MGRLPVRATPLVPRIVVRRGQVSEVSYRFENPSGRSVDFQAVHRITPASADTMFRKQVCFCFERQTLAPGASATLPVRFVVDPALPASVSLLSLDYALFELDPVARSR
jgi:cytochrome c oxidase assembly protein subunit 11